MANYHWYRFQVIYGVARWKSWHFLNAFLYYTPCKVSELCRFIQGVFVNSWSHWNRKEIFLRMRRKPKVWCSVSDDGRQNPEWKQNGIVWSAAGIKHLYYLLLGNRRKWVSVIFFIVMKEGTFLCARIFALKCNCIWNIISINCPFDWHWYQTE